MYNRNYTRSETFQDLISRLYPVNLSEVSERVLYDEKGNQRRFVARTCTFQVTDNCNLACTYCLAAGTKVTMADLSQKNIEDIELGDVILGFDDDEHVTYKPATVDQLFRREVPVYLRLHLENGKVLNITENHAILTKCKTTSDSQFVPAGSLTNGDTVCISPLANIVSEFGDTNTNDDEFIAGYIIAFRMCSGPAVDDVKVRVDEFIPRYNDLEHTLMSIPTATKIGTMLFGKSEDRHYMLGFLSAVYDMCGYIDNGQVYMDTNDTLVCGEVRRINKCLGFQMDTLLIGGAQRFVFNGHGRTSSSLTALSIKFLAMIKPAVKYKDVTAYINMSEIDSSAITYIEKIDETIKVYNVGTSTHTYIADGVCVHNCYQINKCAHLMSFETAKKFADMILDAKIDTNPYLSIEESPGIVFEFIGGEPFMNIDLISQISDYIVEKMIRENHPWRHKFMFSICSNGVKYMDPKVQAYMQKYKYNLSFSISIDGNKELHDSCRVFPDGSGSYDIAMAGVRHFREHYNGKMGSKMTMAPGNITYVYEAVKNLIENDYDEIFLNCVYEKGWEAKHATELYGQFKKLTDYLIETDKFPTHFLSYFEDNLGKPMSAEDNDNWCGGTGSMLSCDYKGDLYPCIRYMESSLGNDIEPLIIGNVDTGIMTTEKTKGCVDCLRAITRKSQSTYECFNCPIAQGCSWCSAYNYQEHGTADKRATYICIMHKGRILSNIYYWNKGFRKYAPWFRFVSWIPKQWALEIISEEEYNMLMDLIKFDESDIKRIQQMLDNGEVDDDYKNYAILALKSGAPVITNDINDAILEDGSIDERYSEVFKFIYDQKFDIDNISCITIDDEDTSSSKEDAADEGSSIN